MLCTKEKKISDDNYNVPTNHKVASRKENKKTINKTKFDYNHQRKIIILYNIF